MKNTEPHNAKKANGTPAAGASTNNSHNSNGVNFDCKNLSKWSVEATVKWLKSIDYEDCGDYFIKHKINGRALLMLNEDDLKEVIKHNVGQRKNLYHLIRVMQIRYNRYMNNAQSNMFSSSDEEDENEDEEDEDEEGLNSDDTSELKSSNVSETTLYYDII
jgi:hypothetical protein